MHSALKNKLYADARAALKIIASLPSSRAVEALVALLKTTLVSTLWLQPERAENQRAEITNFIYKLDRREEVTESFIFDRFLCITKDLLRDGLAFPRREIPGGFLLLEGEALDALLSSLALKNECPDILLELELELKQRKPRRPSVRHKAAERALILALREKRSLSGQRACSDKKEVSGHKMRQGELFQLAA